MRSLDTYQVRQWLTDPFLRHPLPKQRHPRWWCACTKPMAVICSFAGSLQLGNGAADGLVPPPVLPLAHPACKRHHVSSTTNSAQIHCPQRAATEFATCGPCNYHAQREIHASSCECSPLWTSRLMPRNDAILPIAPSLRATWLGAPLPCTATNTCLLQ